jgi:hypothetical protein
MSSQVNEHSAAFTRHAALSDCNAVWHAASMTNAPAPEQTAAIGELRKLDGHFTEATAGRDAAREALHVAIIKHLRARSARPGDIADHTPYDRNWIGALGRTHGVPPLRGPDAPPKPTYNPETVDAALAELDGLSTALAAAEGRVNEARKPLHDAIRRHYPMLSSPEMAKHIKYDRNHILRIATAEDASTE